MSDSKDHLMRMHDFEVTVLDAAPAEPPPPREVVYQENRVEAYFDEHGAAVAPEFAVLAKVFTPNGGMRVVAMREEASNGG